MRPQILKLCSIAAFALMAGSPGASLAIWLNPGPADADLERIVRAAYTAATDYARQHVNYFARDGEFEPLQSAIADEFSTAGSSDIALILAADRDALGKCVAGTGTELRIASNSFGDGLSLAAVTSRRIFTYRYDPHEAAEIVVSPSQDCSKT